MNYKVGGWVTIVNVEVAGSGDKEYYQQFVGRAYPIQRVQGSLMKLNIPHIDGDEGTKWNTREVRPATKEEIEKAIPILTAEAL